jgi:hypothetical protein
VARRARLLCAGEPQHIIQRGNNRQATFIAEERACWLMKELARYSVRAPVEWTFER